MYLPCILCFAVSFAMPSPQEMHEYADYNPEDYPDVEDYSNEKTSETEEEEEQPGFLETVLQNVFGTIKCHIKGRKIKTRLNKCMEKNKANALMEAKWF